MKLPQIIVFDIDGTLIKRDQTFDNKIKSLIKKLIKKKYYVLLATGRPFCYSESVYYELGLKSFLICDNGATITNPIDKDFKPITFKMKQEDHIKLFNMVKPVIVEALFNIDNKAFLYKNNGYLEHFKHGAKEEETFVGDFNNFKETPTGLLYYVKMDNARKFLNIVNNNFKSIGTRFWGERNGFALFEVFNNNTSKGKALHMICDILKIDKKDTISFGDGENDISLFKASGISIAMKNALPNVQKNAHYITKYTNEEEGVYHFLVKNFFI